jgi:hypothetical protein
MRTTVTLDPDVERFLREVVKEQGVSFKEALNDAVRQGLRRRNQPAGSRFKQRTFPMGGAQEFRWDKALAAAEAMEDEERSRKLLVRK